MAKIVVLALEMSWTVSSDQDPLDTPKQIFPKRAESKLQELVWNQITWIDSFFLSTASWSCLHLLNFCFSFTSLHSFPAASPITVFIRLEQPQPCTQTWATSQIQRSIVFSVLLLSGLLCQYWGSATERDWNVNCQGMLMMPFSISAPVHQPTPSPSQGGTRLYLE